MTTPTPTPNSTPPAPGEGPPIPPAISPGVPPPFVREALRRWADDLDGELWINGQTTQEKQCTLSDAFEEAQPALTDYFAGAMVEEFGVPFPKNSAKSDAWARKKGLLPIPDEPLSGAEGIVNLARIKIERDRLDGLAAAQRIKIGMEAFPGELPGPVEMRNGETRQVRSASFDGGEIVIFPGPNYPCELGDLLFLAVCDASRDLATKYRAALEELEAAK